MNNNSDLTRIFEVIRRHLVLLVVICLVGVIAGLSVSHFFIPPKYTSTTTLLVNDTKSVDGQKEMEKANLSVNVNLIKTYSDLIVSNKVLSQASDNIDNHPSVSELKKMVSVTSQPESEIFSISVKSKDADLATDAANEIGASFKKQLPKIMSVNNVSTVDSASSSNSSKQTYNNISMTIGLLIFGGFTFIYLYIKGNKTYSQKMEMNEKRLNQHS